MAREALPRDGPGPLAKGFTRGTDNPGEVACGKGTGCPPSISCLCSPDKPMQMNQALFMSSGQCGYVLQPANMRDDIFDPFDKSTLRGVEPLSISIEVSTSSQRRGRSTRLYRAWGDIMVFPGSWPLSAAAPHQTPQPLPKSCPAAQAWRALAEGGDPRVLLREVPPTSQGAWRGVAGASVDAPPRDPSRQGPVPAGGIHEPQRWHPCPRSSAGTARAQDGSQRGDTRPAPRPLLVTGLLQAQHYWFCCVPFLRGPSGLFSPFLCCAAGDDKRMGGCWWGAPEDGLWTPVESFSSRVAGLRLDRSRVSSWSCRAGALQGYGTARQSSWRDGKAVAVPDQMALMFGPVAVPLACTGIRSGLAAEQSAVSFASPFSSSRPWGGGSGNPAFRCSQVSDNMHKLQLL